MKTIYGTQITAIIEISGNVALCAIGCELRHIHLSKIIGLAK